MSFISMSGKSHKIGGDRPDLTIAVYRDVKQQHKRRTFHDHSLGLTTLEGTVLENVERIKYLGVTITSDSNWNSHVRNVRTKANRTLVFLRRNLFSCPQDVKEAAYKSMVRPILEYGSSLWDPHCNGLNGE